MAEADDEMKGKRRRFRPWHKMKKLFGRRSRSEHSVAKPQSYSVLAEPTVSPAEPPLGRSLSVESVFNTRRSQSSSHADISMSAGAVSMENITSSRVSTQPEVRAPRQTDHLKELQRRLKSRTRSDEGLPDSPVNLDTSYSKQPSRAARLDKSTRSIDYSSGQEEDIHRPLVTNRSTNKRTDGDLDAICPTRVLNTEHAKHRISVRPPARRQHPRRARTVEVSGFTVPTEPATVEVSTDGNPQLDTEPVTQDASVVRRSQVTSDRPRPKTMIETTSETLEPPPKRISAISAEDVRARKSPAISRASLKPSDSPELIIISPEDKAEISKSEEQIRKSPEPSKVNEETQQKTSLQRSHTERVTPRGSPGVQVRRTASSRRESPAEPEVALRKTPEVALRKTPAKTEEVEMRRKSPEKSDVDPDYDNVPEWVMRAKRNSKRWEDKDVEKVLTVANSGRDSEKVDFSPKKQPTTVTRTSPEHTTEKPTEKVPPLEKQKVETKVTNKTEVSKPDVTSKPASSSPPARGSNTPVAATRTSNTSSTSSSSQKSETSVNKPVSATKKVYGKPAENRQTLSNFMNFDLEICDSGATEPKSAESTENKTKASPARVQPKPAVTKPQQNTSMKITTSSNSQPVVKPSTNSDSRTTSKPVGVTKPIAVTKPLITSNKDSSNVTKGRENSVNNKTSSSPVVKQPALDVDDDDKPRQSVHDLMKRFQLAG